MSSTSILPLEAHDPEMYMAKPGSTALYAKENKRHAWQRMQRNSRKALLPASAIEPWKTPSCKSSRTTISQDAAVGKKGGVHGSASKMGTHSKANQRGCFIMNSIPHPSNFDRTLGPHGKRGPSLLLHMPPPRGKIEPGSDPSCEEREGLGRTWWT